MPTILMMMYEFFKTGLFAVGGGLATLPFLFDMAERHGWFTAEKLTQMIAVSESTPGPIGINVATYVGFTTENMGVWGALATTLSLVLPSLIVIIIIAGFLEKFRENKLVQNTFYGLRAAVVGLLSVSILTIFKSTFVIEASKIWQMVDYKKVILFAILLFGVLKFKKHPIVYIAIGAAAGLIYAFFAPPEANAEIAKATEAVKNLAS